MGGGGDGTATMRPSEVLGDTLLTARGTSVAPKTVGQKRFVDAMRRATVTFAIGPAGTARPTSPSRPRCERSRTIRSRG